MNPLYTLELGQDNQAVLAALSIPEELKSIVVERGEQSTPAHLQVFFGHGYHSTIAGDNDITERPLGGTRISYIPGETSQIIVYDTSYSYGPVPASIATDIAELLKGVLEESCANSLQIECHVRNLNPNQKPYHPRFQELCPEEVPASV